MNSHLYQDRLAILCTGVCVFAGCSAWPAWLPGEGQRRLPRSQAFQAEPTSQSTAQGRGPAFTPLQLRRRAYGGKESTNAPVLPWSRGAGVDKGQDIRVVDFVFDLVRIDIPLEGLPHSRKVWNHVDELRLDPALTALLARNGLRIGAATEGAWAPIRAIFDVAHAQVRRDRVVAPWGAPLLIRLASIRDDESIFLHTRDGALVGKTFPAGEKVISVDYSFHPELGGASDLQIQLEIRHDRGRLTWRKQGDEIRQLPDYSRYTFTDLIAPLRLNAGEFVVIGLNHDAPGANLLGSRFLTVERMGRRFETLLCVTPLTVQSRVVQRRTNGD